MKSILFVSTLNLATNPRLVKEIELAIEHDFEVSVICFEFNNWSKTVNEIIKQRLIPHINYVGVSGNKRPFSLWLMSSLLHIISQNLVSLFPQNKRFISLSLNKRSWILKKAINKNLKSYDWVVAHNPGSFYPAYDFTKRNGIKLGIDLEDYHSGEHSNRARVKELDKLQSEILPACNYISAASPLILEYTIAKIKEPINKKFTVLNFFNHQEFVPPTIKVGKSINMVWFSQNIAEGRGLESIIPCLHRYSAIHLHLIGNCEPAFYDKWVKGCSNIILHPPVSQIELHQSLAKYDIGLAVEPGKDVNNELAVSNKMIAYFQAGMYILSSQTAGQQQFMKQYAADGIITSLKSDSINDSLEKIMENIDNIRSRSNKRFEDARKYCWRNESLPLLQAWSS